MAPIINNKTQWLVAAALVLLLGFNVVLLAMVLDLRDDRPQPPAEPGGSAVTDADLNRLAESVRARDEKLRVCFNNALRHTLEDYSRYVFGGFPQPELERVIESCASIDKRYDAQAYKKGLNFPVDMAWIPGTDQILFTEKRTGNIQLLNGTKLAPEPCYKLDANAAGSRGTLGIALDPGFDDNGWFYVYYTNASPLEQRVIRLTFDGNGCGSPKNIVTGIPVDPSAGHNGGQLEFVGNKLFVSTGDGYTDPGTAQDKNLLLGKILRYEPDGSVPKDNPFADGGGRPEIWAYGLRNPFGMAADPEGRLYVTDNGPECDDEIHLIEKGGNYGSGNGYQCGTAGVGDNPIPPLIRWDPTIVPTDLWFYDGKIEALAGDLYFGDFGAGQLHRITLDEQGTDVLSDTIIFDSPTQIVDVSEGPGGYLYFMTPTAIHRIKGR